jgi:hypothetical protein
MAVTEVDVVGDGSANGKVDADVVVVIAPSTVVDGNASSGVALNEVDVNTVAVNGGEGVNANVGGGGVFVVVLDEEELNVGGVIVLVLDEVEVNVGFVVIVGSARTTTYTGNGSTNCGTGSPFSLLAISASNIKI